MILFKKSAKLIGKISQLSETQCINVCMYVFAHVPVLFNFIGLSGFLLANVCMYSESNYIDLCMRKYVNMHTLMNVRNNSVT